jgi:CubicO group peptidase (beta-lactamase class C family)
VIRVAFLSALVLAGAAASVLATSDRPQIAVQSVDRFDSVRAMIRRSLTESSLPSIAVAVAKDGKIVWEEGFGWADLEQRREATPHTMYSLASISKPITATGLMVLVERGLIDLDKPANEYLGRAKLSGLGGDAAAATVRRVANHSAGLPLHYQFYYANDGYAVPSMDETIARYAVVMNPPGAIVQYSNLGFGIIDYIIERTAGRPYADFMRSEVFIPLGMTHTSIHVAPGLEPFAATRYDAQLKPIPFYDFDHRGASAVYSSAHDLVRFGMFHLKNHLPDQKRILKDETIDAMKTVTSPTTTGNGYGVSWNVVKDDNSYMRVSHTGGMPGVSTILNLYPEANLAVVVLTNASVGGVTSRIANEIAATMLPRYAQTRRARPGPVAPPTPTLERGARPPAPLLGQWRGFLHTYEAKIPLTLTFQEDGDVHARLNGDLVALVNQVTFSESGNFNGRFIGTIPTADVNRHRHNIVLNLWLRDGKLRGQASAQTTQQPVHYALTSYVELTKAAATNQ